MFNVYSMFAGIGGFDLGLETTGGFRTVMQSEIEKYPQSILDKHWPDAIQVGDCTAVDYNDYPVDIDVICGGFPCQDISIAGRQKGITGNRSSLFSEMIRAANHYKPKYILFENVRRLLSINNGEDFNHVLQEIHAAGYNAEWRVCSAEEVGAPHKRERLFIVAWRRELANSGVLGRDENEFTGITGERENKQFQQSGQAGKELGHPSNQGLQRCEPATEYQQPTLWDTETYQIFTRPPERSTYWDGGVRYRNRLVEPNISLLADGVSNRSHQIKAYGNAIVPQVAEYVGWMVLQHWKRRSVSKHKKGRTA